MVQLSGVWLCLAAGERGRNRVGKEGPVSLRGCPLLLLWAPLAWPHLLHFDARLAPPLPQGNRECKLHRIQDKGTSLTFWIKCLFFQIFANTKKWAFNRTKQFGFVWSLILVWRYLTLVLRVLLPMQIQWREIIDSHFGVRVSGSCQEQISAFHGSEYNFRITWAHWTNLSPNRSFRPRFEIILSFKILFGQLSRPRAALEKSRLFHQGKHCPFRVLEHWPEPRSVQTCILQLCSPSFLQRHLYLLQPLLTSQE